MHLRDFQKTNGLDPAFHVVDLAHFAFLILGMGGGGVVL